MSSYKRDNFYIEVDNELLSFYRVNQKLYMSRYLENNLIDEKAILSECSCLNTVILTNNNIISVIITNTNGELVLYNILKYELVSSIILTKVSQSTKYIDIVSINNCLYIFYINENNNTNTLYFRILNNNLILSPPLALDNIEYKNELPFIVNIQNYELTVCYIKNSYPNLLGYRKFNQRKTSWSNFNLLDSSYYPIVDYCIMTYKNTLIYSFIFYKQQKRYIQLGLSSGAEIKRNLIQSTNNIAQYNNLIILSKDLIFLTYVDGCVLKINQINASSKMQPVCEIPLPNINRINKYPYQSNTNITTSFILEIAFQNESIKTDNAFYNKHLNKITELICEPSKLNTTSTESALNSSSQNNHLSIVEDKVHESNIVLELNSRLRVYEEKIKTLSKNNMKIDEEKNKLRSSITSLHEEISKKHNRITALEKALSEKQNLVSSYESKIKELMDYMKDLQLNENELEKNQEEFSKLKTLLSESDIVKNNYINESKELKLHVNSLELILDKKTDEITTLKKQLAYYEEKNKDSFIKKLFKSGN
ncbi:putative nucleic acid-binding Zn-ribbon protein [Clostridium punense]|uniref:Nucleic acid-binding Zn-ribbon protein n=1 Tax=Clostridium punense TaxID=1054297 RepID=A0ABS4K899_9CLOT|nr:MULTISPECIES: hypothetical protein [Clostridium]EQB89624.1 hypothetical protein M918_19725 [Clostridium sp. BL8]MBP2024011.1 putative nucleic acid-binding Zn-ribbon protein [Clostridium punense]